MSAAPDARVYQTEFGPGGNCFAACLATEFGLPLDRVPDLRRSARWGEELRAWAAGRRDVAFVRGDGRPLCRQRAVPRCPAVLTCRLLDGSAHAVLFRDGEVYHDPSPRPYVRPDVGVLLWTLLRVPR